MCSTFAHELGFCALRHVVTKLKHTRVRQEDVTTIAGHSEHNRFPVLNRHQATKNPKEEAHQVAVLQR
ncbi:phosphoglycolate phosphatase-like HAD superfamily hydrolase [Xanthomonas sp. 3376]|nr:phosphoglycolate phosphatase-like HAD superfamily hydrolase [Xanthomonas arboricola]